MMGLLLLIACQSNVWCLNETTVFRHAKLRYASLSLVDAALPRLPKSFSFPRIPCARIANTSTQSSISTRAKNLANC